MRVVKYSCDGGSLAIGNEHARVSLCNNIGDGTYDVVITDVGETLEDIDGVSANRSNWDFLGAVEGDVIKLFDYDCYHTAKEAAEHVTITLSGRYGIFVEKCGGTFWLQQWD